MPPFPTATTASTTSHLALLLILSYSSVFFLYKSLRLRRERSSAPARRLTATPTLLYASATGISKALATRLSTRLTADAGVPIRATDAASFEPDDLPSVPLLLLVLPTHDAGAPPPAASFLARWLDESAADFRTGALLLSGLRFAIFGVGSRAYGETFNAAARSFTKWLRALGAVEVVPLGEGDVDGGDLEAVFEKWSGRVLRVVKGEEVGDGCNGESDGLDVFEGEESDDDDDEVVDEGVDMEDIAGKAPGRGQNGKVEGGLTNGGENGARAMVTPIIRTSLEKQVSIHVASGDFLWCVLYVVMYLAFIS
jgi:tRNA wybutosine-synthesizing protein 1